MYVIKLKYGDETKNTCTENEVEAYQKLMDVLMDLRKNNAVKPNTSVVLVDQDDRIAEFLTDDIWFQPVPGNCLIFDGDARGRYVGMPVIDLAKQFGFEYYCRARDPDGIYDERGESVDDEWHQEMVDEAVNFLNECLPEDETRYFFFENNSFFFGNIEEEE